MSKFVINAPPPESWNPRYVAYAKAHGRDPAAMLAYDRERWPGGRMAGFTVWVSERWAEWRTARGRHRDDVLTDEDHEDFDDFLS